MRLMHIHMGYDGGAERFFVPSSIMLSVMLAVPGAANWSAA